MEALRTISLVLTVHFVHAGDLRVKTLGMIMPFEINQDEASIIHSF